MSATAQWLMTRPVEVQLCVCPQPTHGTDFSLRSPNSKTLCLISVIQTLSEGLWNELGPSFVKYLGVFSYLTGTDLYSFHDGIVQSFVKKSLGKTVRGLVRPPKFCCAFALRTHNSKMLPSCLVITKLLKLDRLSQNI